MHLSHCYGFVDVVLHLLKNIISTQSRFSFSVVLLAAMYFLYYFALELLLLFFEHFLDSAKQLFTLLKDDFK